MEAPRMPTTCDRCGKAFNTDRQHPRRYCSIVCEEGRSPLPVSDPSSDFYHRHLQGQPEALVGNTLVANALKRTCYAPEWHKSPSDYKARNIVTHNESEEIIVYKAQQVIGQVVAYEDGEYVVEHTPLEGERTTRHIRDSDAIDKIAAGEWWIDG